MSNFGRRLALLFLCVAGPSGAAAGDAVFQDGFEPGFQVLTPQIVVAPGETVTYCYYFRTPNSASIGIRRWSSKMQAGMHHLILFSTYDAGWNTAEREAEGTLSTTSCGYSSGAGGFTAWLYGAHNASESLAVPSDDGTGTPLAMEVLPNQPMFVQVYLVNVTDTPLTTSARIKAEALPVATSYTKTASYLTDNNNISIPPMSAGTVQQQTCAAPGSAKFWWLSTRTHRFATQANISDGASDLVITSDWEHPNFIAYAAAPFHAFAPAGMTYACTYNNPTGATIHSGDSEQSDEVCNGIGYFFPAAHPAICVNGIGPL